MEAYVVLRILQETMPLLDISQDGMSAQVIANKDLRKVLYRAAFEFDPEREVWTIKNVARLRYKLNVRMEQYLRVLGAPLGDAGILVYMTEPCLIGVSQTYSKDVFGEDPTQVDIAEHLYNELIGSMNLLGTMSRIANLCARLPARGGTHQYRELLPSRLAALTVCGMDGVFH